MEQNIHQRLLKLKDVALGHSKTVSVNSALSNASYDCGIDALLAVYAECSESTSLAKDKNVAKFLHNYEDAVKALKEIRLKAEDFEVKTIIGQGHFGEVQVVLERSTGEVFAMKVLKKAHILQQADAAFFMQERDIMAWNRSPWITSLSYAFQDATNLYLVMDFHPGGDLLTVMERQEGGLGEEKARFYLAEIAAGLQDLHKLGFVHRDVKPENVIIARSGHTKLVDFGSAARLDKSGNVMESRLPVGTPEYIAPEVLTSLDKSANYGVCCDWWSLGIIAYELLYQATPFEGGTTSQTYAKIMNHKKSLVFPSDVDISPEARDFISKLLRDSKDRISFEGIRSHPFFAAVRWDHLQETVPPYIPLVGASDDASNFDIFEKKKDDSIPSQPPQGFSGKSLPFVGFTFTRFPPTSVGSLDQCSFAMEGVAMGTEHPNQDSIVGALKSQLEATRGELQEVKNRKASLERECVIYQSQLEDYHRKLEMERSEGRQLDAKALEILSQLREQSRLVQELRENEAKASREDLTRAVEQLEQDRLVASNKARRLQEDLKTAQEIRDVALKKAVELKAKLNEVKQESRKEVDALRAKLGKVTKDADSKVTEIQNRLTEALEKYAEVIKKARMLEDTSKRLEYEQEQARLNDKFDQSETIARLKKELVATQDSSLKAQAELLALREQFELENETHSAMKTQYESLKQILKGLESRLEGAESTNRTLVNTEANVKAELQDVIRRLEDAIHDRDTLQKKMEEEKQASTQQAVNDRKAIATLTSAKDMLESRLQQLQQQTSTILPGRDSSEAQIDKLVAEVSSLKSQLSSALHMVEDTQEKSRRAESQCKMDESRLKDQVKSLQGKLNAALAKADEQTEKFFELQRNKRQLEQENSSLKVAVSNTESLNRSLQAKLSKSIEEASKLDRVRKEFEAMEKEVATMSVARNQFLSALRTAEAEKEKLQIALSELESSLQNCKKRSEAQELEICLLKQSVKGLEEQQSETQSTMQEMKTHEEQWMERQRVLEGDLEIAEQQADDAHATIEKEKAARVSAEAKTSELVATLERVSASHAEDMQRVQQQLVAQKQLATKCSDERALVERQLQFRELRLAEVEKEMSTEKQLTSKLFDDLHILRRDHNILRAAHSKLVHECAQREAQLAQVDLALREKESADSARSLQETRLQATIAQQSKLIDYLQGSTSSATPLGSRLNRNTGFRLSGRKSRDPLKQMAEWNNLKGIASKCKGGGIPYDSPASCSVPSTPHVAPCEANSRSKVIVASPPKVKVEDGLPSYPTTVGPASVSITDIINNPPVLQLTKKRVGGFVMQHNIPHSFKEKSAPIYKSFVCAACKGTIKSRQKLFKCTHCDVACHPSCASSVPNTCGLPAGLAEHMAGLEEPSSKRPRNGEEEEVGKEKSGEETCPEDMVGNSSSVIIKKERMAMIREGTGLTVEGWLVLGEDTLSFCTRDPSKVERRRDIQILLRDPEATFVVASSVEVPFSSPAKLANAFMLEQHSLPVAIYHVFLAPNFESKCLWVKCLEKAIAGERQTTPSTGTSGRELKAVTVVPLNSDSLNVSVTSSMLDDSIV